MNAGLFGGTFDPPHTGHLIAAQDAMHALQLDRMVFVPAATPPHKQGLPVTPAAQRARMLELAIEGNPAFELDRIELERTGASYTVDTLRELTGRSVGVRWTLLIGADQYAEFGTWKEPDEIRRLVRLAVLTRAGDVGAGGAHRDGVVSVDVTRIDISSTAVRQRVAAGLPIRYHVPRRVEEFIIEHRLYSRNGTQVTG